MSSVRKLLTRAKNLIKRKGWTRCYYARNSEGVEVDVHSDSAACFCISGALSRAKSELKASNRIYELAYKILTKVTPRNNIVRFNDDECKSQTQAIKMFEAAIRKVK